MSETAALRAPLEEAIQRGALQLDERRFGEFLDSTASDFRYRIQAYSHDLRKDMTFLDHDRAGIAALFELLPKHHVNGAEWLRQVSLQTVNRRGETSVESVSALSLFHTLIDAGDAHVDGGSSHLFAVGRYHDAFRLVDGRWLLSERTVRLHTRQLGIGSHLIP